MIEVTLGKKRKSRKHLVSISDKYLPVRMLYFMVPDPSGNYKMILKNIILERPRILNKSSVIEIHQTITKSGLDQTSENAIRDSLIKELKTILVEEHYRITNKINIIFEEK